MRYLSIIFIFLCSVCYGAELLIQAKDSPYDKGAKKGDIIIVRPDGWQWGTSECLPDYFVLKLNGVSFDDAKGYEEQLLNSEDASLRKIRKFNIKNKHVKDAIDNNMNVMTINDVQDFRSKEIEEKVKIKVIKDIDVATDF